MNTSTCVFPHVLFMGFLLNLIMTFLSPESESTQTALLNEVVKNRKEAFTNRFVNMFSWFCIWLFELKVWWKRTVWAWNHNLIKKHCRMHWSNMRASLALAEGGLPPMFVLPSAVFQRVFGVDTSRLGGMAGGRKISQLINWGYVHYLYDLYHIYYIYDYCFQHFLYML